MRTTRWMVVLALGGLVAAWPGRPRAAGDDASGPVVRLGTLQSRAPASWKEEEVANRRMRLYQFRIPHAEGDPRDAELTLFFFGPGGGGSAQANVQRWKGMVIPPEGKTIDDVAHVDRFKVGDANVTYLDVQGTYRFKERPFDPNAREEPRPDYRMLAVVFGSKGGPYFIRLVGPAKTVERHKKEFDDWLRNFR